VLLDGVDLRDYDLASLRRNIGVIFQDFVRYDFVLKENIGVSQVEALDDDARVREGPAAAWRIPSPRGSRRATTRCWAGGSTAAWSCREASGKRSPWGAPTCAMPRC